MRLSHFRAVAAIACGITLAACGRRVDPAVVAPEIQRIVDQRPAATQGVTADVRRFYEARQFAPAWTDGRGVAPNGARALNSLDLAAQHGLNPAKYHTSALSEARTALSAEKKIEDGAVHAATLAHFDAELTRVLLVLGRDVALGVVAPARVDSRWKHRRQSPDFAAGLAVVLDRPEDWPASVAPRHPEYVELQKGLTALRDEEERGGWTKVPAARFAIGKSDPAVRALRQRLHASGDLDSAASSDSPLYDDAVASAVSRFQARHGLVGDGVAGVTTVAAMNVPLQQRIRQITMNLERWRWMPDDFGPEHILVNIPSFELAVRHNRAVIRTMAVVVGKRGDETPIFSGTLQTVVFSPYWNIPGTIASEETAPAVKQDPEYLRRQNIEVRRGSRIVDPDEIDWDDPEELKGLRFRQRPGPGNALGGVKFLFPNPYHVYLHDTPSDGLFGRPTRAFSHGCVRVSDPQALAEHLLRSNSEWTPDRIADAMRSGEERHVKLPPIPVHIVYFTASAEAGAVKFLPDAYQFDARQAAALANR
jgi:murein L,D-transpeptidase YcbB/YkuD